MPEKSHVILPVSMHNAFNPPAIAQDLSSGKFGGVLIRRPTPYPVDLAQAIAAMPAPNSVLYKHSSSPFLADAARHAQPAVLQHAWRRAQLLNHIIRDVQAQRGKPTGAEISSIVRFNNGFSLNLPWHIDPMDGLFLFEQLEGTRQDQGLILLSMKEPVSIQISEGHARRLEFVRLATENPDALVTTQAGDVVIFGPHLAHRSAPNPPRRMTIIALSL